MNLSATLDFAKTYFKLGPDGRRWARSRRKADARHPRRPRIPLLENAADRRELLRKLVICDQAFRECMPEHLPQNFGRRRDDVYARIVPFAMINLLIRCRLLDAYGIAYDRAAEVRLAAFVFCTREWNDVIENRDPNVAAGAIVSESKPETAYFLLRNFSRALERILPKDGDQAYAGFKRNSLERLPHLDFGDTSEARLRAFAAFSLKGGYSVMFPEIPERLGQAIQPFAQWLYSLDELSDYRRDKAARRPTYFTTLPDPIAEMRRITADCENVIRGEAVAPDRVLSLMTYLTDEIVKAYEAGRDLEREIFGAAAAASSS